MPAATHGWMPPSCGAGRLSSRPMLGTRSPKQARASAPQEEATDSRRGGAACERCSRARSAGDAEAAAAWASRQAKRRDAEGGVVERASPKRGRTSNASHDATTPAAEATSGAGSSCDSAPPGAQSAAREDTAQRSRRPHRSAFSPSASPGTPASCSDTLTLGDCCDCFSWFTTRSRSSPAADSASPSAPPRLLATRRAASLPHPAASIPSHSARSDGRLSSGSGAGSGSSLGEASFIFPPLLPAVDLLAREAAQGTRSEEFAAHETQALELLQSAVAVVERRAAAGTTVRSKRGARERGACVVGLAHPC